MPGCASLFVRRWSIPRHGVFLPKLGPRIAERDDGGFSFRANPMGARINGKSKSQARSGQAEGFG